MPGRGVVLSADPGSFWMPTGGSLKMPRGGHYQCRFTTPDELVLKCEPSEFAAVRTGAAA